MGTLKTVKSFADEISLLTKKGKMKAYLIKAPSDNLPKRAKKVIFDEFYPVALSAFNQEKSEKFEKSVSKRLFNVDCLVLLFDKANSGDRDEKGIAFRGYSIPKIVDNKKIAYIEATAVDANYQGLGIYQAFTKDLVGKFDYVVSRTQNPVVITALAKIFSTVYPVTADPTKEAKNIGQAVAEHLHMTNYDYDSMVGRSTYSDIITKVLPQIENEIKEKVFHLINPERGDCLIAVCPSKN